MVGSVRSRGIRACVVATILCQCLRVSGLAASGADDDLFWEDRAFYAEYDGTVQRYTVMTPEAWDRVQPVSVLIVLHGHGSDRWQFIRDSRDECRAVRDFAADHGMLLVSPDYRAMTSWMGPAAEADTVQLIQQLQTQFPVDRLIISGASMGGTAALTFAALHPELVDGVVSLNGTANLMEYGRFQKAIAESFGGSRQQVPAEYRKRSAEMYPARFTVPLAAATGGRDNVVPCRSTLRLLKKVNSHNDAVFSLHRPEGGHNTNRADTREVLEFVLAAVTRREIRPAVPFSP